MKFQEYKIEEDIKRGIAEQGFRRATDIQYKCIPPILQRQDVLAIAQTGTGKTAAFVIPTLERLKRLKTKPSKSVSVIALAPTRELAQQIGKVFEDLGKYTKYKFYTIHGDIDPVKQQADLKKGVDIVIGTPGRINDLVRNEHLDVSNLKILILDEADKMLQMGFYEDVTYLMRFAPDKKQTLFFSATINDKVKKMAYKLVNKPIRIQIDPKNTVAKNVNHAVGFIKMEDKRFFLEELILQNPDEKILVFARTKVRVDRIQKAMARVKLDVLAMHGDYPQEERNSVLDSFKQKANNVLVTTDLCARGIDIPNVEYVINYDLPEDSETYVHRVGRTGRAEHRGRAISFCADEEKLLLKDIEENLSEPVHRIKIKQDYYKEVLDTSHEKDNWQSLIEEEDKFQKKKEKAKKKK